MKLLNYVCEKLEVDHFTANGIIMGGKVLINDTVCTSVNYEIRANDTIKIKYVMKKYVTRSGYKLEKALSEFEISVSEKVCMDIGASEGGFTDCLIQKGAKRIYAVDVAYGILNWKIRSNKIVIPIERMNARKINKDMINEKCDIITVDVSFISTKLILPILKDMLNKDGYFIILYKPQFELPAYLLGKNGNPINNIEVVDNIYQYIEFLFKKEIFITNISYSPIIGNNGNIEYLMLASFNNRQSVNYNTILCCVQQAYTELRK